jgi:hypothetical protein
MTAKHFHNSTLNKHGVDVVTDNGERFGIACPDERTARTLAAGPELLEALERIVRSIDEMETVRDLKGNEITIREEAREAINKATQP